MGQKKKKRVLNVHFWGISARYPSHTCPHSVSALSRPPPKNPQTLGNFWFWGPEGCQVPNQCNARPKWHLWAPAPATYDQSQDCSPQELWVDWGQVWVGDGWGTDGGLVGMVWEKKQHKHKLFGPDFLRTFLTLTPECPGVKKFLPTTGAAGKRTSWCGRPRFLARTSMTRRVVEKLCTKKVCVDFSARNNQFQSIRGSTWVLT